MNVWTKKMRTDSGNALVLSVLILLTLTSVGVVSVQRTNTDLIVSGNVVRAAQAKQIGDSGLVLGTARLGDKPALFVETLEWQNQEEVITNRTIFMGDYSSCIPNPAADPIDDPGDRFDQDTNGRWKHVPVVSGIRTDARIRQDMAFATFTSFAKQKSEQRNQQVSSGMCFVTLDVNSHAGIPTQNPEWVWETLDQKDTVVVKVRAQIVAGPTRCLYQ